MFPTYHRNLIKPKTTKISILINVFVVFFSLNFNSFLFAPTFAEDSVIVETTVENTVQESDVPVIEETVEETTVEETDETIEHTTEEGIEQVTEETVEEGTEEGVNDVLSGSSDFVDEVSIIPDIGPNLDEVLSGSLDSPLSGNVQEIVEDIIEEQSQGLTGAINSGGNEVAIQIDQAYFDSAFERDVYNHKVFDLQNILISLGFFTGALNGIYDDFTIASVYQYQLSKGIMKESDGSTLRGFFGPTTREYFNQEYVTYKQNLLNGISNLFVGGGISQNIITEKDKYAELLKKVKEYFIQNRYSLENIFGTGVFVGNEDIDFSMLSGQILLPLIFQSTNTLGGNIAEVEFEPGTILKDGSGNVFTGSLSSPEFLNESVADELTGQDIISVLDVGGNDEKIVLEDSDGEKVLSKVKIPVPGQSEGSLLDINYSHDGETWTYMLSQKVFLDNGEPYIEFETTHFTMFSISLPVGTFFVNNNDFSTNTTGVTLNINVSGATHMRFANTGTSLTSASWVTYNTGYSRDLLSSNGSQIVYAEFSGYYGKQTIQDSIFLDRTIDSNLKVLLSSNMNGTNVLDSTTNAYNFSGMGLITNPVVSGEQVMSFNGSSQYAQRGPIGITNYPFSFSAWINADTIVGTDSIVMMGNSGTTTTYYGIQLIAGKVSIVARNTTSYAASSSLTISTGKWYHVVGVFATGNNRKLYINGSQNGTNTSAATFSNTNQQIRVGRYVATATNYFDGYIDDVRIYDKALSVQEIETIYNSRLKIGQATQYLNVGSFSINGDVPSTYVTGVTLNSNVTGMTHMRFANTTGALNSAIWVPYVSGYARTLNGTIGNQIVYAQYSGVGGIWDTQDNIFLDTTSESNLRLLLDGSINGVNIFDLTTNAYNFSGVGSIPATVLSGEKMFSLNGTTQYAQRTGLGITKYPFTFSAWVNADTIAGTDTILSMGNSATTTTYYGIQLVNGAPSIVATNTTARTTTTTMIVKTGQWYHVVGVFLTGNARSIFVNGDFYASATTVASFNGTNQRVRVGRYANSTTTNYFDGYIDDVRVYDKALNTGEIKNLYSQRTSRVRGPTATINYSSISPGSDPVVAILTGFSDNGVPISQNGISIVNNNGSGLYTFTGNGNFTFIFKDSDGNIGSAIASVNNIVNNVLDVDPDQFVFTDITGANLGTYYKSNIITLTGMSPGVVTNISVTGAAVIIKNGISIGTGGTGSNGDTIALGMTSSSLGSTAVQSIFYAGTTSGSFLINTKAAQVSILEVTITRTNSWPNGTGYSVQYTVDIKNISTTLNVSGWTVSIPLPVGAVFQSSNGWNGVFVQNGNELTIDPASYNAIILSGQTVSPSFQILLPSVIDLVGTAEPWTVYGGVNISLAGPASFSFGSTMVSSSLQSREKIFTGTNDYFDVIDGLGLDAGYYTTLAFSDLQYNSNIISKNNIYVKTDGGIMLRAGTANANVVTAITGVYLATSSPLTFIKRDAGTNGGKTGTYGAQVAIKVDIPAFQQPGNYTGTIIYTLY